MKYILFIFLLFSSAFIASAHGFGQNFSQTVGNYEVILSTDLGFENQVPAAGNVLGMIFELYTKEEGVLFDVPFTSIWVRIIEDKAPEGSDPTVFAGQIEKAELGRTTLTYVFPRSGSYTVSLEFYDTETTLAETSFTIAVERGPNSLRAGTDLVRQSFAAGLVGIFVGGGVCWYFLKRKR